MNMEIQKAKNNYDILKKSNDGDWPCQTQWHITPLLINYNTQGSRRDKQTNATECGAKAATR